MLDEGQLEAINNAVDRSVSGLAYTQSLMNALRGWASSVGASQRWAQGSSSGPDLLLTAAHVLRPDGARSNPATSKTSRW